ncbi:SMCs flexible hinge [Lactarius pseudohatsudake]|nr:SMCs flexible hinge [Lactarius pseudohatsudake]
MAAYEKREVGLEEARQRAHRYAEKLKKLLQDVWFSVPHDENTRNNALRSIQENTAEVRNEKEKADQYEKEVQREEETQVFRDQIEQKQKELQPWKTEINQKEAELDVKTSERDMLVKKAEAVEQASAEAQEALETVKSDQKAKIGELENLKTKGRSLQREANAVRQRVRDLIIRVNQHRAQASSMRQCAEEAKASQAASASQNKVLDSLTRLRTSGRVSGFHGRLGSLGTIPDEYDAAITTACGSLNDLVTDTVQQGQACIKYLRKQAVGRADFLALEKIDETNGMRSIQTPENVPRLFDLVEPKEPWFAHAFYKALRDTLVAQDLAQANRIASGARRWRVVTLAGELIDSSGTMSGGAAKPRGGADAVPPDLLQKYEQDSEATALKLTEAMEELRAAEAELEAVGKSGSQINLEIDLVNLDIQNAGKRVIEAEKWVHDFETQSKPGAGDLSRVTFLEREIPTTQNELKRLQSPSGTIEEAIKALERKILDIGGSQLLAQRAKVDGLKLHIDIASKGITRAEVAMTKAEKDLAKHEGSIARNQQSLEGVEIELEKLSRCRSQEPETKTRRENGAGGYKFGGTGTE